MEHSRFVHLKEEEIELEEAERMGKVLEAVSGPGMGGELVLGAVLVVLAQVVEWTCCVLGPGDGRGVVRISGWGGVEEVDLMG